MNEKYNITIGVLNHNNDIFNKYIKNSLKNIKNHCEVIILKNLNPAKAYNEIIKKSKNNYIVLLHCDTEFGNSFLDSVFETIKQLPDFGVLGILGVKKVFQLKFFFPKYVKKYIFANSHKINEVQMLEPSCIVINKKHNLKFDDINFDEYHHIVEDYCAQVIFKKKLKLYTLLTNTFIPKDDTIAKKTLKGNYFIHYNSTFNNRGSRWGNWLKYKKKLDEKWNQKIITT